MSAKLKKLKFILNRLHLYWTFFNMGWLMILSLPWIVVAILIDEKRGGQFAYKVVMKFWGFLFAALSGIFFKSKGREKLRKGEAYVFTANHSSYLDSPALVAAIPDFFKALGKQEILNYPIFGFIFKYIGVTVDRSNTASRKASLLIIKKKIEMGIHILFFPEGTMNTTNQTLTRFFDGAFWLAIETQTPVVPVAIKNSRHLLSRKNWLIRSGTIEVEFGDPIPTQGLTLNNLSELKLKVQQEIKKMLEA
jgi:1-acyl-sn-glycerol-3-phosphate acyltransferase